jgi:hypothetical protein
MSLGACRCCSREQDGCLREGEGRPTGGGGRGPAARRRISQPTIPLMAREVSEDGRARPSTGPVGESAGGGGRPDAPRFARRGSTVCRQTNSWNCSTGEDPLPEPFRTRPESCYDPIAGRRREHYDRGDPLSPGGVTHLCRGEGVPLAAQDPHRDPRDLDRTPGRGRHPGARAATPQALGQGGISDPPVGPRPGRDHG